MSYNKSDFNRGLTDKNSIELHSQNVISVLIMEF